MAKGLHLIASILFIAMLALIFVPVFCAIFSDAIANRVHLIEVVLVAAFGTCGTLLGAVKSIEQWGRSKGV